MKINNKKNHNGFTLTELIIVIVIIGILAAVLIPAITQYIERARYSNDKSDARNMTMLLNLEAYDLDQDFFETDYVVGFLEMNGYNLKARSKGNGFCYNYLTNAIEIVSEEQLDKLLTSASQEEPDLLKNPLNKIRNLGGSYLYIDKGESDLAKAIDNIVNLLAYALGSPLTVEDAIMDSIINPTFYDRVVGKMNQMYQEIKEKYGNFFSAFDPSTTVFVDESGYYSYGNQITNVIISKGTTILPNYDDQKGFDFTNLNNLFVPSTVQTKNDKSFLNEITTPINIIVGNSGVTEVLPEGLKPSAEVLQIKKYSKYQNIEHIKIEYKHEITGIGTISVENSEENDNPKSLMIGGNFSIDFSNITIHKGSSIDIKSYTDERGLKVYDVRIFDINGVLYARGIFRYWLTAINMPTNQ